MAEKIKSVTLALLVILSLLLTYQLWYGKEPVEVIAKDSFEKVIIEPPKPLEEVFLPAYVVIPADKSLIVPARQSSSFASIWEITRSTMASLEKDPPYLASVLQEAEVVAMLYFAPALPAELSEELGHQHPGLKIAKVAYYHSEGRIWLTAAASGEEFVYTRELSLELATSLKETVQKAQVNYPADHFLLSEEMINFAGDTSTTIADPLILPQGTVTMAKYALKPEQLNRDQLLKTFFVDYNLVRAIEGKDGNLIYTDGEKGLRLTKAYLEFSNPRYEQNTAAISYYEALTSSNSYIAHHGGWLPDLRLSTLETTGGSQAGAYVAQWQIFIEGFPLFTKVKTKAVVNDRGLVYYSRALFQIDESLPGENSRVETAGWAEALEKAISLLDEERFGVRKYLKIEAMGLGYVVVASAQSYLAEPVWFIQINGKEIFLNAGSLGQIKVGELT